MVYSRVALVPRLMLHQICEIVVESSRIGRSRISIDQLCRNRIPAISRYLVARKNAPNKSGPVWIRSRSHRVVDRRSFTEITAPHRERRNVAQCEGLRVAAITLVIDEEESVILTVVNSRQHHRSAKRPAELIQPEIGKCRPLGAEEISRIHRRVSQKLESTTVQPVSAGLCDHVYHCARVAADIGAVQIGLNLELADRLNRWTEHNRKREPLVIIDTVVQEVVGSLTIPIREDLRARPAVVRPGAAHNGPA